jgi:hypothetical protein
MANMNRLLAAFAMSRHRATQVKLTAPSPHEAGTRAWPVQMCRTLVCDRATSASIRRPMLAQWVVAAPNAAASALEAV